LKYLPVKLSLHDNDDMFTSQIKSNQLIYRQYVKVIKIHQDFAEL